MDKKRVMIVDDSTFTIGVLKRMLESMELEVIDTAMTVKEAIEKAQTVKPDLITMDMTLPDGTGIECAKEILKQNKAIKILAISAMMDDEIIEESKAAGILGYIQKPMDQEKVKAAIERIFEGDELYSVLKENYEAAFKESIFTFLKNQLGGDIDIDVCESSERKVHNSLGTLVTIGIIGRHDGRFIMDMSDDTAVAMTRKILQDEGQSINDAMNFLTEFANIVAGNACSLLNGMSRSLGLRVSPPTIIRGDDVSISIGDMLNQSCLLRTPMGEIFMNTGFKKGDQSWM